MADSEILEVRLVLRVHLPDQFLWCYAHLFCPQHGGGAVGVVGADIDALMAAHALESYPDVRLDMLHQVAKMNRSIGVGQSAGDKDTARFHENRFWVEIWGAEYIASGL